MRTGCTAASCAAVQGVRVWQKRSFFYCCCTTCLDWAIWEAESLKLFGRYVYQKFVSPCTLHSSTTWCIGHPECMCGACRPPWWCTDFIDILMMKERADGCSTSFEKLSNVLDLLGSTVETSYRYSSINLCVILYSLTRMFKNYPLLACLGWTASHSFYDFCRFDTT